MSEWRAQSAVPGLTIHVDQLTHDKRKLSAVAPEAYYSDWNENFVCVIAPPSVWQWESSPQYYLRHAIDSNELNQQRIAPSSKLDLSTVCSGFPYSNQIFAQSAIGGVSPP